MSLKKYFLAFSFLFVLTSWAQAAKPGHQIEVTVNGFTGTEAYLAYYLLDNQYILDTVAVENGTFTFEGEEPLASGMYLVVLPPDNRFFQLLINEEDQHFQVVAKNPTDPSIGLKIKGSPENELFYDYLELLTEMRPQATELRQQIEAATEESQKEELQAKLDVINAQVLEYQESVMKDHPNSLTAAIIRSNTPPDMPEFTGEDAQLQQWQYSKAHYFDYVDLGDPRLLRMPFLFQRVDHYITKMTVQHPDSINVSLFTVLEQMRPSEETFKHYLVHYLNEYAASKVIGFDAVYVFLVEKYYATGMATWTDPEQLENIVDNAKRLRPLLIGKVAPDFSSQDRQGNEYTLHTFAADYTILLFWDPGCGHCKKEMPELIELYNEYNQYGVEIFAVCTKFYNEMESCWEFVDEKEIGIWLNTIDPYHRSKYKTTYDIKSTPQIYLLDKDKVILYKRLGATQIPDILDNLLGIEREEEPAEDAPGGE
jgi:thiol-disulfide isomerase/thioredoxin